MTALLLFGSFALFCLLSVPIGVSLGISVMITIFVTGISDMSFFSQGLAVSLNSFPLMAAPFFILAGNLMSHGGISRRLMNVVNIFFGRFTGGLGVVTVVSCMFFAAISGTGSATVAAIGSIMVPEMLRRGYNKSFSSGMIASAGSIGAMIPPSVTMVVYCVTVNVSITSLFLAGIVPGVLVGLILIAYTLYFSFRNKYVGNDARVSFKEALKIMKDGTWALLVPVIILGGIYGGIFTPTEASAVAVVYGFFIGVFIYKELKIKAIPEIIIESALMTSVVLVIIGTSTGFGRILTLEKIPDLLAAFIVATFKSKILILLLINLLLLLVGTFMETLAAVIILAPILLPVVQSVGISPVHFGIIMVVNLAIGFVTPPLGANLFVTCQIVDISFEKISRAIIPWLICMIIALLLITYIPEISLFLPSLFDG